MADLLIIGILYDAKEYKNYDKLIDEVKNGNPLVLENLMTRELIVKLMVGDLKVTKRREAQQPRKSPEKDFRDRLLNSWLWYYIGAGFPKYNSGESNGAISACDKVIKIIRDHNELCDDDSEKINFTSSDSLKPLIKVKPTDIYLYEKGMEYANNKTPLKDIPLPF